MKHDRKKVIILGDSLMRGIVLDADSKSYSVSGDVNWKQIEDSLGIQIINRSRMGATVKYGLSYLSEYIASEKDIYAAVIEYGGNDCDYNWEEVAADGDKSHFPKTKAEDFETSLNRMVDLMRENDIKPILMTLPPISSLKYYDWITRKGLNRENIMRHLVDVETIARHHEYYNNIVVKIAYARDVDCVDIRNSFLMRKDYTSLICEDGIHPSVKGGQLMVEAFLKKYGVQNPAAEPVGNKDDINAI